MSWPTPVPECPSFARSLLGALGALLAALTKLKYAKNNRPKRSAFSILFECRKSDSCCGNVLLTCEREKEFILVRQKSNLLRKARSLRDAAPMLRKLIPFMLSVVLATLLLAVALLPVHAASALVQQNNVECSSCSSTLSVSFTSNVASGDVIVVGVVIADASFTLSSLTDSLSSSFTQSITSTNVPPPTIYIFYATLSSSGADIVTAAFSAAAPAESVYIYEVSGVNTTGVATATGSGVGTSISTSLPVTFQAGAFLLGIIATNSFEGTATAGTGFTPSADNSGTGVTHAQYSISGITSSTNFPATTNSVVSWVEDGIALMPI